MVLEFLSAIVQGLVYVWMAATFAGWWLVAEKAGVVGWHALIPFYGLTVVFRVAGYDWWWILIPVGSFVIYVLACHRIALAYGRSGSFCVGMILLSGVFWPILGVSGDRYQGVPGQR